MDIKIKFNLATDIDSSYFFKLRNDPTTRAMSRSNKFIIWSEHHDWFTERLKNTTSELYIVTKNDQNIGTIRIDKELEIQELSWMIEPSKRGLGLGKEMLKYFIEFKPGSYLAVVRSSNIASQKICEAAGFYLHESQSNYLHYTNYRSAN